MERELIIPGEPCGQPRVKATLRAGHAAVYTPKTVKDEAGRSKPHPAAVYKASIQHAWGTEQLATELPVRMHVEAVFPRPSAKRWKTRPMPSYPHCHAPDGDNIAKAIMDALNGLAYRDDSQIWSLVVMKRVASGDESPHTRIVVMID